MLNKFISIILIMGMICPLEARIRIVQHKATDTVASGTTAPITLASTMRDNNLIVVGAASVNNRTVTSVTDNATGGSNLYVQAQYSSGTVIGSTIITDIWYCVHSRPGATTITINMSGVAGTDNRDNFAFEIEGFQNPILDKTTALNNTTGNGTDTGPNLIATGNDGFILAIAGTNLTITATPAAGNEFTSGGDIAAVTTNASCSLISQIGGHVPAWTDTNTALFAVSMASFKEAPTQPAVPFGGF